MAKRVLARAQHWTLRIGLLSLAVSIYGVWIFQRQPSQTQLTLISQVLEVQEKVATEVAHLKFSAHLLEKRATTAETPTPQKDAQLALAQRVREDAGRMDYLTSLYDRELEKLARRRLDHSDTKHLYNMKRYQASNYVRLAQLTREIDSQLK